MRNTIKQFPVVPACARREPPYYLKRMHSPPTSVANQRIFTALTIALRFAKRTPTLAELRDSYGMSKSTAYRWIGAIEAAKGKARTSGPHISR